MPVINRIAEFHADMTEWRHDFHTHPELALKENRTSGIVQEKLRAFGVDDMRAALRPQLAPEAANCWIALEQARLRST